MAISRNNLAAAVAGTLSVAMLAGCPNPGATPTPSTSAPATTAPTAAPSASVAPSAAPSGVTPSVVPSASTIGTSTLRGIVYDTLGAKINSGKVQVSSLNPSNPFDSTVDIIEGSYVVNNVPAGVQLRLTATKPGYTARTQVQTLLPLSSNATQSPIDFGTNAANDSGLSDAPQVIAVEPVKDATGVAADKLLVKVTLSEALNASNRTAFANALSVTATGGISIADGSQFAGSTSVVANATWDADGKVVTLAFNAPLLASSTEEKVYTIALASVAAVKDESGKPMVDAKAFYLDNAAMDNAHGPTFKLVKDTTAPTLEGVAVRTIGANQVVELAFSEPMAAYQSSPDGVTGTAAATVVGAGNFTYALGEVAGDITKSATDMGNTGSATEAAFSAATDKNKLYKMPAAYTAAIEPTNPKIIRITPNTTTKFPTNMHAIKVWVSGNVSDPATNGLSTANDTNIKSATF